MASYKLIVAVVRQGRASSIMRAARAAGAEGGTMLPASGTGKSDFLHLVGVPLMPRREVLLTAVPASIVDDVLAAIQKEAAFERAGEGFACVLALPRVAGMTRAIS